jgi:hypothetical protein
VITISVFGIKNRKLRIISILEIVLKKMGWRGMIDAQSVKNTDTTENKGYDAGKKKIRN